MKQFLLVFLGGGFGSVARYAMAKLLNTSQFPFGTLAVNILGSFMIGCIIGFLVKENSFNQNLILLLATGFCGGFTTFSAFSLDNLYFLKEGNYGTFAVYSLSSVSIGLFAVFIGIYASKQF